MKEKIRTILEAFFPNPQPPLLHSNHFTLLIAILLSASAQDIKVNSCTPKLFALADNPFAMRLLEHATIYEIIRPIGLASQKAQAILQLSDLLVKRYGGIIPNSLKILKTFPGVGHKTAAVFLVQAFGDKTFFPVDTHIMRCAKRWQISTSKNPLIVEEDLKLFFAGCDWAKLHLQIIFFARRFCPAKSHLGCPICCLFT